MINLSLEIRSDLDGEINGRKTECRNLNQKIDDVDFELTEKLRKEAEERNNKMKDLENTFNEELGRQRKFTDDFREKATSEFNHITTNLMKEMQHRLSEQDDVIDSVSNIVRTIQDTLKVLGKDV